MDVVGWGAAAPSCSHRRDPSVKRNSAPAALLLGFALAAAAFAGCSSPQKSDTSSAPARPNGTITAAGSTALLPLVKDTATEYQLQHKDVKISVSGGGSAAGITQVAAGAIDIGDSDITASGHPELKDHRVAVVGFAIATHPSAGVKNLTRAQLRDIFAGKIANWKDAGGADQKIVVVNRPRSSGTRAVFVKVIMGSTPLAESGLVEDATGTAVSIVAQTPGAVTYVALSGVRSGVTIVAVDGITPTPQTIATGKYPIWSYEHMFTRGEAKGHVADFIAFTAQSADLLKKNKFIAVGDMKVTETDR
jgi:phosphate transport system substrate-binding protein